LEVQIATAQMLMREILACKTLTATEMEVKMSEFLVIYSRYEILLNFISALVGIFVFIYLISRFNWKKNGIFKGIFSILDQIYSWDLFVAPGIDDGRKRPKGGSNRGNELDKK